MTSGPELPERDRALERAWRAQSRETPSVELDRAILAAAHRAVGSGPQEAAKSPEAKQPQRWWMPLAAAATIGAVAVGLLQLAPQDAGLVAPTERIVAVAPHRDAATSDRKASAVPPPAAPVSAPTSAAAPASTSTPASATAPTPTGTSAQAGAPAESQASSASAETAGSMAASAGRAKAMSDQGERAAPGAPARADKETAPADARGLAAKPQAGSGIGGVTSAAPPSAPPAVAPPVAVPFPAATPAPTSVTTPTLSPAPSASPAPAPPLARAPASPRAPAAVESAPSVAGDASSAVGKLEQRAPEPFPAASRKVESTEAKKDSARAATDAAPAPRVAASPPPSASDEQDARIAQPKDVAGARQSAAANEPRVPAEGAPALAATPAAAGASMRMRENTAARDEVRAQAAPPQLAKQASATVAEAKQKARDPDAWIARIRKLREDGNTAEAIRELRDFREYVPDADRRIPPDLRDLANAVRP